MRGFKTDLSEGDKKYIRFLIKDRFVVYSRLARDLHVSERRLKKIVSLDGFSESFEKDLCKL
jgi:hypothetical protein